MKNFLERWREKNPCIKKLWLIMRLSSLLILLAVFSSTASVYSQATKLTLKMENARITEVFDAIEQQSEFYFFYNRDYFNDQREVSIDYSNKNIEVILDELFEEENVEYEIVDRNILIKIPKIAPGISDNSAQQQPAISGTVTDEAGQPLPGVTVVVKGTTQGTVTNADGNYSLNNVPEDATLVFSFVGMQTKEVVVRNQSEINISLSADVVGLDEVVVTALGIEREEKALGYAVQKIEGEKLQRTKGAYAATSLTGKIAGLWIKNSTEFNEEPDISLRGENPLLVVDGVAYSNMNFNDIAADDIESINVLKGGTASALYGYRGSSGAIIITTKNGRNTDGIQVDINSNNMFAAGFLALPEVQSSYGHGINGALATDYVWGPKLDVGDTGRQWNPVTKQWEDMPLISSGKNNFQNFLEQAVVSNTNISLSQAGENGSFRVSLNHVYNKGQYPNLNLNRTNFTVSGVMSATDKFTVEGYMGYNRQMAPQTFGQGYGSQGYIYQILLWTGPDYDIRDYKDYWIIKDEKQNWLYDAWYDNPYMMAYERLNGEWLNKMNANLTLTYNLTNHLKATFRNGYDMYSNEYIRRNPININSGRGGFHQKGLYRNQVSSGWSINSDFLLMYKKELFNDFDIDFLAGSTLYRYTDKNLVGATNNGLVIPGYYSLKNSRDPATVSSSVYRRQVNSIYSKLSFDYKDIIYFDVTGRNDWSSTHKEDTRSFFYPSVSSSIVLTELFEQPSWLDLWKVRGAWTVAKSPLGIYDNNQAYNTGQINWQGLLYADYPNDLINEFVLPNATRTYELGTSIYFKKRLKFDFTHYNKLYYNQQRYAPISEASGFSSTLINTEEEHVRKGWEISVDYSLVDSENFSYNVGFNWSKSHIYYNKLDPNYSADNLWTGKGKRVDAYVSRYWLKDDEGNVIHRSSGLPWRSDYDKRWGYSDPDFIWGITNRINWKRFDVSVNFDGRIGGVMYNYTEHKMWDTGSHPDTDNQWRYDEVVNGETNYIGEGVKVVSGSVEFNNYGEIISDTRVYEPNDIKVSYQSYARNYGIGNMGIVSGTFLKLRDFSIGYNFPQSIAGKIGASNLYLSLTGQNVFLWTKEIKFADPDKGTDSDLTSPSVRYLGVNLNASF
ncbi:TonB-linked outer membrane protein, SusC/RagA family [Tangfeifania diversioriginum]|uniref:TonB-linked outer membrane protein, SusC/RagA family n=1 Tax=Tangfeifania diversioriginum TaxID=1168035 RepID=A0A1M6K8J4_9BACT|nr:SusC/RagA family TonB-linked outer membrane protein [Tangfeifania diversioriginum]SHJ55306.1 TonB-linked outer membrane protein, SusC/RagA family [Tangfeifania diversioriginum]